ncbi:uncharacterized protein LOC132903831 [Amyelois transitella]|uniref:uncharacterized protein LOC132903831 n=1 Tax=Amyelois transitella TaxID=680683 RepID=UPI0029904A8E|nr:uncharacterized protein LOC132903831 [Amyelois transitella]
MATKSSCVSMFAAAVLIMFNIIVVLVCLTLLAFGIWAIVSPHTLSAVILTVPCPVIKALLPPHVVTAHLGAAAVVVATVAGCIACMGLRGAINGSPFFLFMYTSLVLLLLLLECSLFYYFSSSLVEKGLQEQDGQWTHALRLVFTCCEYNSSSPAEVARPWSCCGVNGYPDNCTIQEAYDKDCRVTISAWLNQYQTTVYVSLAAAHIILSSCSILRRRSASRSYS